MAFVDTACDRYVWFDFNNTAHHKLEN